MDHDAAQADKHVVTGRIDEIIAQYERERHSGGHVYLSTGCLHGAHDYCASMVGLAGVKRPAMCKFCGARCVCDCHKESAPGTLPG